MRAHKKIISVIFLVAVLLFIVFITQSSNSYLNTLEKNWDIVIPQKSEILYETEEKANIFGDGCRYHILECNKKMFLLIEALNHMRKFPRKTQVKLQVYWILWGFLTRKDQNLLTCITMQHPEKVLHRTNCIYWQIPIIIFYM